LFTPAGCGAITRIARTIAAMPEVVEITLRHRVPRRLAAGFPGWSIEWHDDRTVLRRVDANGVEIHAALVEAGDLGLELESFHRLTPV
jgi:hypothetical protein